MSLFGGFGLLTSSSSLLVGNFLSSEDQNTSPRKSVLNTGTSTVNAPVVKPEDPEALKREIEALKDDESFKKDYSKKEKGSIWGRFVITALDNSSTYTIRKPNEELTFPNNIQYNQEELEKIKVSEIKIHLLVSPIWSKPELTDDLFRQIPKEQVELLFKGLDHNKVKRILLQLNTRRFWIKSTVPNENYYISVGILRMNKSNDLRLLKIKYFKTFDALRKFIYQKVTACTDECNISESDLKNILDQDKQSFFDDLPTT